MIEVLVTMPAPRLLIPDRVLFPGQVVEVDETDPEIAALLTNGDLTPVARAKVPTRAALAKRAKGLGVEGHTKADHNTLAEEIAHAEGEARAAEESLNPDEQDGMKL